MSYDFNGTNRWLSSGSSPISDLPLTLCCWAKTSSAAFGGLISIGSETGASSGHCYRLAITGTGRITVFSADGITNAADVATSTTTYSNGSWFHAAAVFSADDVRTVYLDAGGSATNTNSNDVLIDANTHIRIGRRHLATGNNTGYFTGQIAEVGIWNAALTAEEIASLAKGMTCDKIRPQSLVFYAPLVRDLIDQKGGLTITNNNSATVADHPRIY